MKEKYIAIENIEYHKLKGKKEVLRLSEKAKKYLESFKWCDKILDGWLAFDFDYILCIFYFNIVPSEGSEADDKIWIIVGDIPSAYLDAVDNVTEWDALDLWVSLKTLYFI